jgi:hypothetical protein
MFVIASEAQAIDDKVFEQIDAILTGEIGLLIEIGNPLRSSGQFAKDIGDKKNNIVLELSCLDTPNYQEKRCVVPGVASYEWVEEKRLKWGEDDPRWFSRVLGKIPKTSIDNVFGPELVNSLIGRKSLSSIIRRGVAGDVARFGDDETVIYGGENGEVWKQDIYSGVNTSITASRFVTMLNGLRGNFIGVDGDGIGGGSIDVLRGMSLSGVNIYDLKGSAASPNEQYQNFKAWIWFEVKRLAEEGKCSMPDDSMLIEELMEMKYFINARGKIQIESKDDVKDRLGRSPDRADAWIMYEYLCSIAPAIKRPDGYSSSRDNSEVNRGGVGSSVYAGSGAMAA